MAVDLGNYVDNLKREINPPGTDGYPTAVDDEWIGALADAFWEARIDGVLVLNGFTCDDNGLVTPIPPGVVDLTRDLVQLVILYASFKIIRNTLRDLRTQFRASAGPVTFEYQQSANLLVEIMKDLVARRNLILTRLSDLGSTSVTAIDAIVARDQSLLFESTYWVASGSGRTPYGLSG